MRRIFILIAAVAITLLGAAAALAGNIWNGYHWADVDGDHTDNSISLTLVDHIDPYQDEDVFDAVLRGWNRASNGNKGPLTLNVAVAGSGPCDADPTDAKLADIKDEIHVCNREYGVNGWLGLAQIWLNSDGHIQGGVALLNDSYLLGENPAYNNKNARQHVLCQEIGHTFGLDHQKSRKQQTCMNDRWGLRDDNFVGPNAHDFETLIAIYGATLSDEGNGGKTKPCNAKKPGCAQSGTNVHITPRPGGGWIITYTFPAGRGLG